MLVVALGAFALYRLVVLPGSWYVVLAANRITDTEPVSCPWNRYFTLRESAERFASSKRDLPPIRIVNRDPALGIIQVDSPGRSFWLKEEGRGNDGPALIRYLLAEHEWMRKEDPDRQVRPGEIVMDCGAHVGTFVHQALQLGAAKVVAVEPDATNIECLRRNFKQEIAAGKVVVYPKAVWDSETTLKFTVSGDNSGMNSAVIATQGRTVEVPATRIDTIVRELNLPRLDRIKMDIEGAERNALRGGMASLRQFRPKVVLETYHLPDDAQVLPAILREAHPDYRIHCGPCEYAASRYVPHVLYVE